MYSKTLGFAGFTLSLFAIPAFGHHSFAMFDQTQTLSLTGTVTEFEWINPHSWLHLAVVDASGNPVTWAFETSSPRGLAVVGWTTDTVKVGDSVEIGFHPLRDGSRGGQLSTIVLPDGIEMCSGAACRERLGVTD